MNITKKRIYELAICMLHLTYSPLHLSPSLSPADPYCAGGLTPTTHGGEETYFVTGVEGSIGEYE